MVEICTQYAQKGMFNIFFAVFFATLAFAFVEPYFFIGYLISIALFGLYQAIFMANAGGAWDNAKKIVEVELKQKGTPLHEATVVGDTVGDPFKDTSSVALNPIIKFTTLFGLLAVELAVSLTAQRGRCSRACAGGAVLPGVGDVRVAVVLPDADRSRAPDRTRGSRTGRRCDRPPGPLSFPLPRHPEPHERHLVSRLFSKKPIAALMAEADNPNGLKRALGPGRPDHARASAP